MEAIEVGWFLPTSGDTTAHGVPEAEVSIDPAYLGRVVQAAEEAGFEYLLIPVDQRCWEAYIAGAFMAAQTRSIKPLIAARPGYINPVLLAKMISTFDQFSNGRICVNLIGPGGSRNRRGRHHVCERGPLRVDARRSRDHESVVDGGRTAHLGRPLPSTQRCDIVPKPAQQPFPRFYLGGGSAEAWDLSAEHSDVHLFWGDTPERIVDNIARIRELADRYGRRDTIQFGMRLQMICRETEAEALAAAEQLICNVPEAAREILKADTYNSEANRRVQQLVDEKGLWIAPHLERADTLPARCWYRGGWQPGTMCRYAAAVYRRGMHFVLPVGLPARRRSGAFWSPGKTSAGEIQPRSYGRRLTTTL